MLDRCLNLACEAETIEIEFDVNLFGARDSYENVFFNIGDNTDTQVPVVDSCATKWTLSCPIGECGMKYKKDDENKYSDKSLRN